MWPQCECTSHQEGVVASNYCSGLDHVKMFVRSCPMPLEPRRQGDVAAEEGKRRGKQRKTGISLTVKGSRSLIVF